MKSYYEMFVWVLPTLFFLFIIWDKLKFMEYKDKPEYDQDIEQNQRNKTKTAFRLLILQFFGFLYSEDLFVDNKLPLECTYIIFTISSLLINIYYRMIKHDLRKEEYIGTYINIRLYQIIPIMSILSIIKDLYSKSVFPYLST